MTDQLQHYHQLQQLKSHQCPQHLLCSQLGNGMGFAMGFSGVWVGVQDFVPQKNLYLRHGYGRLVAGFFIYIFEKCDVTPTPNID